MRWPGLESHPGHEVAVRQIFETDPLGPDLDGGAFQTLDFLHELFDFGDERVRKDDIPPAVSRIIEEAGQGLAAGPMVDLNGDFLADVEELTNGE